MKASTWGTSTRRVTPARTTGRLRVAGMGSLWDKVKKAHYVSEIPAAGGANNRDNENGLAVLLADARGKKPMLRSSVFHTQRLAYLCVCGSPEK